MQPKNEKKNKKSEERNLKSFTIVTGNLRESPLGHYFNKTNQN